MSDKILKALMQLFAIVANSDEVSLSGRKIVDAFLRNHLSESYAQNYLLLFDGFIDRLSDKRQSGENRKKISVSSVKVLRICSDINKELDQKQKLVVLIRLIEFINNAIDALSEQHYEFVKTVAEIFSISPGDYENILVITKRTLQFSDVRGEHFLLINAPKNSAETTRCITKENLNGNILFVFFEATGFLTFRYEGPDALFLNGRLVQPGTIYFFEQGSVIRANRITPLYYNDIRQYFPGVDRTSRIRFEARNIGFSFKANKIGLHTLNFSVSSGNLVGIMGNSGSGKSTLLSLLNGSIMPSKGQVFLNDVDLHSHKNQFSGLIGNIPQDDLLIEELTVFENLFFSARLYFGKLNEQEVEKKVNDCLLSLGLDGIKHLTVGDPLNKFISGGQRKRLNIALELIREPAILFVDEPTSGLSSNDSENVMDLLKRLTLAGKLIFVVIHQPSSGIFKLFDELLILDLGGYPVYYGKPVDSIAYFKREINYADPENSECPECGTINAEEIFKIIELKTVDEFGRPTEQRKITSTEWYRLHTSKFADNPGSGAVEVALEKSFQKPILSGKFTQFLIYFKRNFFAKLNNRQYLVITLLEAPLLAAVLALALHYQAPGKPYIFGANPNIPAWFFICTIVALFFGLIGSAEEIINDKKILKRESFLQFSRTGYLLSKVSYLFIVSIIQAFLFIIVGHFILGIHDLLLDSVLVFFSVSCFGNLLGLNISSGMKTRVAVYILVPFLIIPQIMLSGVMVKFEDLSPWVGSPSKVPMVGNVMASRWAFESLIVNQFKNNKYEKTFFDLDQGISNTGYRNDYWIPAMDEEIHKNESPLGQNNTSGYSPATVKAFFVNEFQSVSREYPDMPLKQIDKVFVSGNSRPFFEACRNNLQIAKDYLIVKENVAIANKDIQMQKLLETLKSPGNVAYFKQSHANEKVEELVKNSFVKDPIINTGNVLVRKFQPVFKRYSPMGIFSAPFYVYEKQLLGIRFETIWFNLLMIWTMTLILYITLYFDWVRKLLEINWL